MNYRNIYVILLMIVLSFLNCGKDPVFTEMSTNRLKIRIKGTFETEDVSHFDSMSSQGINSATFQDDSVDEVTDSSSLSGATATGQDIKPTTIMLDIAEIRLGGKKISNYRQVFEIPLDDTQPFFNGTGIELKTDDPGDGYYDSVQIYFRKMVMDNAKVYKSTGSGFEYEKESTVIFHEDTRNGLDFNQLMVNSHWDSLRLESADIIRVFPIEIPIVGGLTYKRENNETVLEIRLVLKNFIKKYEYKYYEDGVYKVCHYYAPSDWLRDVKAGEKNIGRNLHAVARAYVPGNVATSVTVSCSSGAGYIVAVPATENISYYSITTDGVSLRAAVGYSDLPTAPLNPGEYVEPTLDYYLKYEKYKYDWNTYVTGISTATDGTKLTTYEDTWDSYEIAVHGDPDGVYKYGLKIPPYVAYNSSGSVTFKNMAPGTYSFYYIGNPASYGALFLDSAYTDLAYGGTHKITQTINANVANSVNIP